jgi:hypothetical protein
MTKEDIIRMAREVELFATTSVLIKFAALVAAAEREAAIEDARTVGGEAGAEMEKLIRARREQ